MSRNGTSDLISTRIRASRLIAGLTNRQFAKRLGVSLSTAFRYQNGATRPSIEELGRIAEMGGHTRAWILSEPRAEGGGTPAGRRKPRR